MENRKSFSQRYQERQLEFRKEVHDHYNQKMMNATSEFKSLQVADDAASNYLNNNPEEKLVTKGVIASTAVIGGILAAIGAVNVDKDLMATVALSLGTGFTTSITAKLGYKSLLSPQEKIEDLSRALIEKEVKRLSDNPKFEKYSDILFEIMENGNIDFLKNTMVFSEKFTEEVAKNENGFLNFLISENGIVNRIKNVASNIIEEKDQINKTIKPKII